MTFPPGFGDFKPITRGIGLASAAQPVATPPSSPPSSPAPSSPAPTTPTPTPKSTAASIGIPQMQDDPIAAVGFVLQQFAAGLQGRELPSTRLRREALQQQQMELQQIQVGAQVLEHGIKLLERTPEEQRSQIIERFGGEFAEAMPGLQGMLSDLAADLPSAKNVLGAVGEFAPQLYAFCGSDVECIRTHAADATFMEGLQKNRDRTNMPIVGSKLREITAPMHDNAETIGLTRDDMGDFVMSLSDLERLNETLPENLQLSSSEMRTIERNPNILVRYGIKTPEMQEFEVRERFKSDLNLREISARAALDAKAGDKAKSDLVDDRGNLKSEVSNDLFRRSATLFGAQVDPRTGLMTNLTRDMAQQAQDISVTAAALIQQGRASSVDQAIAMASTGRLPEAAEPEVAVPTVTRESMTAQNAEIARVLPMIEERLDAASGGTGFVSNLAALADATVGQVAGQTLWPDIQKARQELQTMGNELRRALANNPRFSEGEQRRISALIPGTNDWLENPSTAASKMQQLIEHLKGIETRNLEILGGEKPEARVTKDRQEKAAGGALSSEDEALLKKYGQ